MLYLGLDTIYPDEPHHHVLFADDYRRNVEDIQGERVVSDDMSIYVRNSCVTDPLVAPAGKSGLYLLVPTINTRHGFDWKSRAAEYRDKVLARVEERTGMKDLRSHIVEERTRPDIPAMPGEVDGIAELWFDDREAMTRAMATPEAKALHADGTLFIGRIKSFTVEEKVIIPRADRA